MQQTLLCADPTMLYSSQAYWQDSWREIIAQHEAAFLSTHSQFEHVLKWVSIKFIQWKGQCHEIFAPVFLLFFINLTPLGPLMLQYVRTWLRFREKFCLESSKILTRRCYCHMGFRLCSEIETMFKNTLAFRLVHSPDRLFRESKNLAALFLKYWLLFLAERFFVYLKWKKI